LYPPARRAAKNRRAVVASFAMHTTLIILALIAGAAVVSATVAGAAEIPLYIGTSGNPDADDAGIYLCRFDADTGTLSPPQFAAHVRRPSFLAAHPGGRFLYACDEMVDSAGKKSGGTMGFAVDPASGKLSPLNESSSGGAGPCFVEVDPSGRVLLVANYGSGSVAAVPIDPDTGKLAAPSTTEQHQGKSANEKRQTGPHAHCFRVDPTGKFALSCDLGTDKVMVYRLDPAAQKFTPNEPPFASTAPGAGPRHIAFAPGGKHCYINGEMGETVTAYAWDGEKGTLSEIQTISTLPSDWKGTNNTTAEVAVAPDGKFLYVSNRGHDSIAIFAIDPSSGKLAARGHAPTGGKIPRHFAIAPGGRFMVVGNQGSNELVVFKIDPSNGELAPTGTKVSVVAPTCVRFWNPK
jgi:6-phosphogluconolactonase